MRSPDVRGRLQRPGAGVSVLSGAVGRWFVTPHAVQQYRERMLGGRMSYEVALGELVSLSTRAHFVRHLESGAELWRGPKPARVRMIVMRGFAGLPQLVTVLRGWDDQG